MLITCLSQDLHSNYDSLPLTPVQPGYSSVFSPDPASCCNKSMWIIIILPALDVIFDGKKVFRCIRFGVFSNSSLLDLVSCIHESIKVLVYKMLHVLDNFNISLQLMSSRFQL